MSLAHLEGKRTGRRPGSKSTPPWIRDARWAYRNLGRPGAEPPSPFAAALVALAREHPDRFLDCMLKADFVTKRVDYEIDDEPPGDSAGSAITLPDRLASVWLTATELICYLTGHNPRWTVKLPEKFELVALKLDPARLGVFLIFRSPSFALVGVDQKIPEMKVEASNEFRQPAVQPR